MREREGDDVRQSRDKLHRIKWKSGGDIFNLENYDFSDKLRDDEA